MTRHFYLVKHHTPKKKGFNNQDKKIKPIGNEKKVYKDPIITPLPKKQRFWEKYFDCFHTKKFQTVEGNLFAL